MNPCIWRELRSKTSIGAESVELLALAIVYIENDGQCADFEIPWLWKQQTFGR